MKNAAGIYGPAGVIHRISGNTDGATALIRTGTFVLFGGNNITLSQNGNSVSIEGAAGGTGGGGSMNISAGTTSNNLTRLVFSDSNGLSFGLNGSTITGSHNGLTSQSNQALSGSNGSFTFQTATFGALNGLTFYTSNGSIVGSYTVPTQSIQTQNLVSIQGSTGDISFGNANGITFGGNASTITASHNGLTSQSNQAFSAGAASSTFQTLSFQDSNGISFSNNAGAIRVSHDLQFTSATSAITSNALHSSASRVFNILAATNSTGGGTASLSSNVSFSAANGFTFYTSAGNAIVGSYTVPTVPAQFSGGLSNVGNTSGDTGVVTGRLVLAGGNNITLSGSTNGGSMTVTISAGAGGGGLTNINLSAGTTSQNLSNFVFSDSNGISFGLNGSTVTASYTVPTQTNQTLGIYALGNTTGQSSSSTYDARTLSMEGAGIVSVGWSNGSVRISATQSNQAFSAGAASSTFQTLTFQDSNGISFSNNAGAIRLTHDLQFTSNTSAITSNALHSSASRVFNILAATNNTGGGTASLSSNVSFSAANGLTFYTSAGNAVVASYTVPTVPAQFSGGLSNIGNTSGDTGVVTGRIVFAGGNNITLSGSTNAGSATITISAAAGGGGTNLTAYAQSNTTQSSSGTIALSSLNFAGAGIASVGITNGSVVVSVPAGGGAGDGGVFAGVSNLGNTAGSTGTVSTGNFVLVGSNNISLSQSTGAAGSAATVTVNGIPNQSAWLPYKNAVMVLKGDDNQSIQMAPHVLPHPVQYDRLVFPIFYSQATNSTLTVSRTIYWGLYTKTGGTLSLVYSSSGSYSINGSGTASSSANSGIRVVSMGDTTTIPAGNYFLGIGFRSSTAGANATCQIMAASNINSTISGYIGVGSVTNQPVYPGLGVWISTSSQMPGSLAMTDIRANSSGFDRSPIVIFTSGTT